MTKSHLWHVCVSAIVASLTATSVSPYLSCGEHYQKGVTTCNLHLREVGHRSERSVRVGSHQATEPRAKKPRATKTHRHLACNLFSTQQSRPPKTPTGLALVISDGGGRPHASRAFRSSRLAISANASRPTCLLATASLMRGVECVCSRTVTNDTLLELLSLIAFGSLHLYLLPIRG